MRKNTNEEIGKAIKQARNDSGFTQQELATKIGKTESSIRKYEKGIVSIPTGVLDQIALALNTSTYNLMYTDDNLIESSVNELFGSFVTDIICTDRGLDYEIKLSETDQPFTIDSDEYHQIEKEAISFIEYQLYKLRKQKEGDSIGSNQED